jgi:hypothetical protein
MYPDYEKNGIIKEDKLYIYYINKVWSKSQSKYLKPLDSRKGKYINLIDTTIYNNNPPYKYVKYPITT